ncbi:MAG TPA: S8 family serine peptidase [Candidatus Angelobacter sp.]|jgi:subtilisin family serine protease|nr:S8 family serine peptidase [Candidatus Angelobacter sp.]
MKTRYAFVVALLLSLTLSAQTKYLLTTYKSSVSSVCSGHGLTYVSTSWNNSNYSYGVYLVTAPSSLNPSSVTSDSRVLGFEVNRSTGVPELSGATSANLTQSTEGILDSLPNRTVVSFFGVNVPSNYPQQPATSIIRLADARGATGLTGAGTVAIIDTGVDPNHPALSPVLLPGFDFTRNQAGASELADLSPTVAASLSQSTEGILDSTLVDQLNSSTLAILTQSTEGILDGHTPSEFGHGTMTAGLVHLVAPTARILPLKAFRGDGSSDLNGIVSAIYYAADHGAGVISMSFEITQSSPALQQAISYAQNKGIVVVAAAGNDNFSTAIFPASLPNVFGTGATSNADAKSTFSNFDPAAGCTNVMFAAPGEGVITTYPGKHYAAGWGTSFSTPIVAGAASLILQQHPGIQLEDMIKALWKAVKIPQMGHGRIDLFQALTSTSGGGSDDCASTDSGGGDGGTSGTSSTSGKGKG